MSTEGARPEASPLELGSSLGRLRLLRVHQWPKNLFVFAGVFFGQRAFEPGTVEACLVVFALFCLLSSAVYVMNDLVDVELDRRHPYKRHRPLPSGAVRRGEAFVLLGVFLAAGLLGAWLWMPSTIPVVLAYLAANFAYSMLLKHVFILDVFVIASGFVLRVYAGCVAINEPMSDWVVLCTGALALFLAFSKRRMEWSSEGQSETRSVLGEYPPELTNQLITISAVCTIVCYGFYCSELNQSRRTDSSLMWTLPPVVYGILHYLRSVRRNLGTGRSLIIDLPLAGAIAVWLLVAWVVLY